MFLTWYVDKHKGYGLYFLLFVHAKQCLLFLKTNCLFVLVVFFFCQVLGVLFLDFILLSGQAVCSCCRQSLSKGVRALVVKVPLNLSQTPLSCFCNEIYAGYKFKASTVTVVS